MRPVSTHWFELLTTQDRLAPALECLARTGAVELETHDETAAHLDLLQLQSSLDEYQDLAARYRAYWPPQAAHPPIITAAPKAMMAGALDRIRAWAAEADASIARLQTHTRESAELRVLCRLLEHAGDSLPNLKLLVTAGPMLRSALFLLPAKTWPKQLPALVIYRHVEARDNSFFLGLGPSAAMEELKSSMEGLKAQAIALPAWLPARREEALSAVRARLTKLDTSCAALRAKLQQVNEKHDLPGALADIGRLEWFAIHAQDTPITAHFARITGWTSDGDGRKLHAVLDKGGAPYLLRFCAPPQGLEPPMILHNPGWARAFELFTRLLGTPAANETDPSQLVAVIAPLLFGYMFGDVGQGLLLLMVGVVLCRRVPALRMLISGGLMSIVFGFLFGSLFSREDVLPAMWLHPLEQPVTVLVVTLAAGAIIILLGLTLDAVQDHWRDQGRLWWRSSAGLVVAYLGLLGALAHPAMLWLTVGGVLWYLGGSARSAPRGHRVAALARAAARLIEVLYQLAVNTVSFARVGAFALAHAGLSAAVSSLADIAGTTVGFWLVMVLGNVLVIVLEGLVVGIQTTRLLLFEFFVRFMRTGGRAFHPLLPPGLSITRYQEGTS